MFQIMKYLGEFKASVAAVILLLILQAYCDLSLPSYTSQIVDVGIEQGGIENAAPDKMREETLENICLFAEEDAEALIRDSYVLGADGAYELQISDEDTLAALNEAVAVPIVMVSMMGNADLNQQGPGLAALREMEASGMITKAEILEMKNQALEEYGEELSDMIVEQMAIMFVKAEYEALGIDVNAIQTKYLLVTGAKMLLMTVLMMTASIAVGFLAARVSAGIGLRLRNRVFQRVVSFSHAEMEQFSTASLITRSTNDIQQVQMVAVMLLRMVCYAPLMGIGGIIKVVHTKTGMGWIIAVAVGLILLLVGSLVSIAMPKFKLMQTLVDRINLVSREILTGIPVIRAFSREKYEEKRFDKANRDLMSTQIFTNRVMTFMMPTMMFVMNGIAVLIVWFGAKGIDAGNLQIGDMMAFITYSMQIVMAFLMLTMISVMLPRAGVAAERIEAVLHTEPTILDKENVKDAQIEEKGLVAFEDVCFRYPEAEEDALSNISFVARPGETTAIIGSTGCGKSTLLHLLPRFYDVTNGRITIDGVDIRELSQKKLRSLLGFVPQKGVLFSGTIESNIKFAGEDSISDETMREAADIAQAKEFIESKNERYLSPIAQGGTNVSGGQKQRLSIARAIAKNPKVFLFDDSFSALDYKTDAVLRKALGEKISDATVIIVAQRISTILHADQIIVLDEGRIAGIGTHEELLENCAAYQEIARSQLSEAELKGGRVS
ncbi:MAG: ABC transporter ATP-binding protein/permease [Blautia sp.]|nr:ABC transporter ATP-binding protein/permease [Lachnoclostridium sp.]MCM1211592.1 ABC transporter ATP-binding protein/permease [Blautia sp.]